MAKILVCDDDKDIVEAIDIYLTQEGYEVLKAYDGDEAIKVLKRNEVDLLIMDVMMPRLDGIRATLKIRENMSLKTFGEQIYQIEGQKSTPEGFCICDRGTDHRKVRNDR